jgi:hypothetical protein
MLESMRTITLNEKQRRRWEIITRLIANKISNSEAGELLERSNRQVQWIRQRYEADGVQMEFRLQAWPLVPSTSLVNGETNGPRDLVVSPDAIISSDRL